MNQHCFTIFAPIISVDMKMSHFPTKANDRTELELPHVHHLSKKVTCSLLFLMLRPDAAVAFPDNLPIKLHCNDR
jgi:hypothetical protein